LRDEVLVVGEVVWLIWPDSEQLGEDIKLTLGLLDTEELGSIHQLATAATNLEAVAIDNGDTIVESLGAVQGSLNLKTDLQPCQYSSHEPKP
jgi:hypothetical protein